MVILPETPFGIVMVFFRSSPEAESPVQREYEAAVRQPREMRKIEQVFSAMEHHGLRTPGLRVEKVKGADIALFELKITAAGAEHRFLAGYNGVRAPEGKPYLVVVKYLKKKEWKLSRTAIDTAVARLARME
jgi:hypothetical protein